MSKGFVPGLGVVDHGTIDDNLTDESTTVNFNNLTVPDNSLILIAASFDAADLLAGELIEVIAGNDFGMRDVGNTGNSQTHTADDIVIIIPKDYATVRGREGVVQGLYGDQTNHLLEVLVTAGVGYADNRVFALSEDTSVELGAPTTDPRYDVVVGNTITGELQVIQGDEGGGVPDYAPHHVPICKVYLLPGDEYVDGGVISDMRTLL